MSVTHENEIFRQAVALQEAGHVERARVVLQEFLKAEPEVGQAWELLGILAGDKEDGRIAIAALEQASLLVPLTIEGQLALARCYDRASFRESAKAIYLHVATLPHVEDKHLQTLAEGLGKYGEYQMALAVCRQAAKRAPHNPEPILGIVYYMRRLRIPPERILPTLYRAYRLAPDDIDCRITLAWLLHETGQTAEGARLLERINCGEFTCIRCLTLMQHIHAAVGNVDYANDCRNRLKVLAGEWPDSEL